MNSNAQRGNLRRHAEEGEKPRSKGGAANNIDQTDVRIESLEIEALALSRRIKHLEDTLAKLITQAGQTNNRNSE